MIKPFDAANYLENEVDVAAYLAAAAEGGDASHFARALGAVARARNMSELARETGLTAGLAQGAVGKRQPVAGNDHARALGSGFTVSGPAETGEGEKRAPQGGGMRACVSPLPIPALDGERVGVRGARKHRTCCRPSP